MKIKEIRIRNFRGIDNLEMRFMSHDEKALDLAVLAGPNGCGKTSVLEACLLLLGKDALIPKKETVQNIRKSAGDFHISGVFEQGGCDIEVERSSEMNKPRSHPLTDMSEVPVDYFSSWRYPKLVGLVPITVGRGGRRPQDTEENRLWRLKQYLVNLTASKAFEDSPGEASTDEKNAYEKMNTIWRQFYPSRNEKFVAKRAGKDLSEGFEIFLEGRADSPIAVDNLSSGEIEIFTLLGQCILRPLEDGILVIDEPELHLHSSWHRAIVRAFRQIYQGTQLLFATHSQEVLDSVYSFQRFTLLPEKDPRIRTTIQKSVVAG